MESGMASIQSRVSDRTGKATWRVDYTDAAGIRRAKNFKTRRHADNWRMKVEHEISTGIHTPESLSVSVREAGDLWIKSAERRGLERSTIKQYKGHLNHHIGPYLGATKLTRLTAPHVE